MTPHRKINQILIYLCDTMRDYREKDPRYYGLSEAIWIVTDALRQVGKD